MIARNFDEYFAQALPSAKAGRQFDRKFARKLMLTTAAVAIAALYPAAQAMAQEAYSPILAGPVVGGVAGIPLNLSGFMDVVPGPSMAITVADVTGFQTKGGDGSGGGAGLGGALFVGTGAIVDITTSRFTNNVAKGGNGGTGSIYGGSLNGGGIPSGLIGATSLLPGIPGLPGTTPYGQTDPNIFGDGTGNGRAGNSGNNGITAGLGPIVTPFVQGGQGGQGGAGQNGWVTNPNATQAVTDATTNLSIATQSAVEAGVVQGVDTTLNAIAITQQAADIALSIGSIAAEAEFTDAAISTVVAAKAAINIATDATQIAAEVTQLSNDAASVTTASQAVTLATQQLTEATSSLASWYSGLAAGIYGGGGNGGSGGNGGNGGFGAAGGPGGDGGTGGIGYGLFNSGNGGNGGNGGISGFGAGGSQGGNGGQAGLLGVSGGQTGAAGVGGIAGFGGGVGSSGTGLGVSSPIGGGGGDGLGGAIFVQTGGTVFINGISLFMGNSAVAGQSQNGGPSGQAAGNSIFLQGDSKLIFGALPTDVTTFIGPQSIADDSVIGVGGLGNGSITVAAGTLVMAPGTSNQYAGSTTVGSVLNPLSIPGLLSAELRANDGDGLPSASQLIFTNAGILETSQNFNRTVGVNSTNVTWQGSGGFAYWNGVVTASGSVPSATQGNLVVTLSGNEPLTWGLFGFVPVGSALVFGANDATGSVTFTNDILTGLAGVLPLTTVNITVVANKEQDNAVQPGLSIPANIDYLQYTGSIIGLGGVSFNDLFNTGTIYLLNQQYYTGPTFLNNGLLALQGKGSIAPSMLLDITNANAVFDITQTNGATSVGGLAGFGTIQMGTTPFSVTGALGPLLSNFGGVINGSAPFTVAGGYQVLSGINTYTGVTTVNGGAALGLAGSGSILASVGLVNNGLFDISATTSGASIQTMSGNGLVNLGSQTLTLTNARDTFSGSIGGAGGLVLSGGTETLTGVNTYAGMTNVQSGTTLVLSGAGSIANSVGVQVAGLLDVSATTAGASLMSLSGAGNVALGAQTLTLSAAQDTFGGVISGSGGVALTGGTETLTGVNTYTGQTLIAPNAALYLSGTGSIATSVSVQAFGTLDISNTTSGASIMSLGGGGSVNLGNQNLTVTNAQDTFAGSIAGTGNVTIAGGSETLAGTNAYTGLTTIAAGSNLNLTGAGAIAYSAGVVDNGLFDISGTTYGASITTLSGSGTVQLGSRVLFLTNANDTFAGTIIDPPGGAVAIMGGAETLSGVNTYSGQTYVAPNAALYLSGAGSIANSNSVQVFGTVDISNTASGASFMSLGGIGSVNLGNQNLTITNADDVFAGVIGGTGGVTIAGGIETFGGVNTYTGQTTIANGANLNLVGGGSIAASSSVVDNGVLDISGANGVVSVQSLSGAGSVATGGNSLFLTAANDTFAGAISGNGGLALVGGTETLTGSSTYFGGTYVAGANLVINSDAALGDASGSLTLDGAELTVTNSFNSARNLTLLDSGGQINTQGNSLGLSGVISGPAQLVADGGGLLTLTGVNTYSGGTVITNKTTLAINADSALGASTGTVNIVNGTLLLEGALTSNRTYYIGTNSSINANGYELDLTGPIYLQALNYAPLFSGTAQISGGAWTVTPTMLTLAQGSTLHGVGTITMPTTVNGLLKPGNSPGTLVFSQSLTLGGTATLGINVDGLGTGTGAGNYSRIVVGGAFTAGGTLAPQLRDITGSANNTFTPTLGQSFVIATAAGGVNGSFATLVEPTSGLAAGSRFDVLYTQNAVTMYAVPITYTNLSAFGVTLTGNQASTGASLDAMRPLPGVRADTAVTEALAPIYGLGAAAIPGQLDHLAATGYGDALASALDASHRNGDLIEEQIDARLDGNNAAKANVVGHGGLTYWTSAQGGIDKASNSTEAGHRATFDSVIVGVDKQLHADTLVGVAVNYSSNKVKSARIGSGIDTDVVNLTGYLAWNDSKVFVDGRAGLAFAHYSSQRSLLALNDTARGKGDGLGANASANVGYRYTVDGVALTPEAGADLTVVNRGTITEYASNAGAAVALTVKSDTLTSLRSKVGFRMEKSVDVGSNSSLALSLRAYWEHELGGDLTPVTQAAFASAQGTAMDNVSVRRDASTALVGGGMMLSLPKNFSLWARYTTELGRNTFSGAATAGLRWRW